MFGSNERPFRGSFGSISRVRLTGSRRAEEGGAPATDRRLTSVVLGAMLCVALLVPSVASAHFVRPFLRQFTGTPTGEEGAVVPFGFQVSRFSGPPEVTDVSPAGPFGVAVDGEDDVWVAGSRVEGEGASAKTRAQLDEFGPSGVYGQTLELSSLNTVESLAVGSTGAFYVAENDENHGVAIFSKTGVLEKTFHPSREALNGNVSSETLAVDDSTDPLGDPSAGDLYDLLDNQGRAASLQKFNAAGEPRAWENFKGSESCHCSVSGNEIFFSDGGGSGVAVDPANGDIWVAIGKVVFAFSPGGELIREVTGEEAPGLEQKSHGFYGVEIEGLAVDPTNEDLLVSLTSYSGGAVDEFDSEGVFLGQIVEAGGQRLSGAFGIAVDSEGDAYVVNHDQNAGEGATHAVDEFERGHFVPGLRPAAATRDRQSSAALNGFVDPESELNPERAGIVDCRFEYVSEAAYEKTGFEDLSSGGEASCEDPDAAAIPKDDAYTPVHAEVSEHIESGVTYRYRLSATTGGLKGGSEHGVPVAFTAAHAPRVSATAASGVTSTFARLSADVAPLGASTTYQFQYLSEEQFQRDGESFAGAAVVPANPVDVGSGGEAGDLVEAVSEQVAGLVPGTTYRFRLVASNEVGVSEGEAGGGGVEVAHTFTTDPAISSGLPEGRSYELVTPPDKEGAEDMFREASISRTSTDTGFSSESGDQFMLATRAAFGAFPGSGGNLYVFSRHPAVGFPEREEWSYESLASPALGLQNLGSGLGAVEPGDLSKVAFTDRVGAPGSEAGFALTSLLGPAGGPYTTLHTDQQTHEDNAGKLIHFPQEGTVVVGASRDLGDVVLSSTNPALAEGGGCKNDFCEEPPIPSLYEWTGGALSRLDGESIGSCGAELGSGRTALDEDAEDGAVSADGSRIFFTAPISIPETQFRGLEGVRGCPTESGKNPPELYMRSGEETVEVSAPEAEAPETIAGHEAVFMGAALDGWRVFFTSEGELTANDSGIHDVELYEYDTETGKLKRVSAGESGDAPGGVIPFGQDAGGGGVSNVKDVVVSGDGSHVYFVARSVLAPANGEGRSPVQGEENLYVYEPQSGRIAFVTRGPGGAPTPYLAPETTQDGRYLLFQGGMLASGSIGLYRYDADTEGLACVTCTPGAPSGVELLRPSTMEEDGAAGGTFPAHAIAGDGSVFFNTPASLVAQDTNGVTDVYEWHEGAISLISSGQDVLPSFFLGASPNGANVFFGTHARLVAAATGTGGNLYDARVCTTAEPCIAPPPAREGLCEGDACSHPAAAPSDATPASATFSGAGDLTPPPPTTPRAKTCVKPKKLSHGRCVAVKAKRRKPKAKAKAKARGRKASAGRATRSDRGGRSS
jgi:DNA-binding beta-propeller fold protein YncE